MFQYVIFVVEKLFVFSLALYSCDSNNTNDIVCRASSGQVVNRFCDTLCNRSVCFCFTKTLSKFVSDVSCIKVREYQNVCFTCNFAARSFGCTNARYDCCVKLEFTIKFEFRMLGSSNSIACANIMLNAAVAQSLKLYADELEQAEDFNAALHELIKRAIKAHKRIIFNGNGYDDTWIREATEKRGLLNLRTTPDAIPEILKPKNIEMLTTQRVYTETELRSRYEIMLENYCKTVCIEAQTMSDMARKQILPAVAHYAADVARDASGKQALDPDIRCGYETKLVKKLMAVAESIDTRVDALDGAIARFKTLSDVTEGANFIRDEMLSRMTELRVAADEAETLTAESAWPFPTYGDLLFSVK